MSPTRTLPGTICLKRGPLFPRGVLPPHPQYTINKKGTYALLLFFAVQREEKGKGQNRTEQKMDQQSYDGGSCGDDDSDVNTLKVSFSTTVVVPLA